MIKNKVLTYIKKKNFLIRLLLYFFSFLIPIILIAALAYNNSVSNSESQFKQRISQNLNGVVKTVDSYFDSSQTIGLNFFADDIVKEWFMPQKNQIPSVSAEKYRIPIILTRNENLVSNYVDSIFSYFYEDDVVYCGSGIVEKDFFYNNIYINEKYGMDFWNNAPQSYKTFMILSPINVLDKSKNVNKNILPIITIGRVNTSQAAVVVNISIDNIKNLLKGISIIDSTEYIVTDSNNTIILSTTEIDSKTLQSLTEDNKEKIKINNKEYVISNVNSSMFGMKYYALISVENLNHSINELGKITLIICCLLIILSSIFAYKFSLTIYRPIRSILDTLTDNNKDTFENDIDKVEIDKFNKSDEIKKLKYGIEKLSINQRKYKQQYYKRSNEYIEHAFQLLRNGMIPTQISSLVKVLQTEFGFVKPNYLCCNILLNYQPKFYKEILDIDRITFANNLGGVIEYLLGEAFQCYVMEMQKNIYTCIINCNSMEELTQTNEVFNKIQQIFDADKEYYNVIIGIGDLIYNLQELHMSYNTAMTAIQNRSNDNMLQRLPSDKTSMGNGVLYTLYDQQKLINCVKSGNPENLIAAVSDILDTNIKMGISFDSAKVLYQQLLTTGIQYLNEQGENINSLENVNTIKAILNGQDVFTNIDNSKSFFSKFYDEVMLICASKYMHKNVDLVEKITEYVNERYSEDLCLDQIADDLMVSMKYVSRIFKQKTGVNLTDYIYDVRVDKAKELLKTTNLKINEISSKVGIESRTTFLRVFKKRTGVTPNEYRNL